MAFKYSSFAQAIGLREHKNYNHMTAYVVVDDCVPQDLYICVRDQCSRTVASVKAKLHLMLRPYYILTLYWQFQYDIRFIL